MRRGGSLSIRRPEGVRGFAARLTAGESAMLSRYTGESATGAASMVSLKSAAGSLDPRGSC